MAAGAALVAILFWDTGTVVETPLHGTADVYVPPVPVTMAPAERREVIEKAALFVRTAVRRDHAERAYELAGPGLRAGTTRADWRRGDIPVVPYPVDVARWELDYSYEDEIGLQVAVFPERGASVRPAVFAMSLRAVREGASRRWVVDSWSPRGSSRSGGSAGSPLGAEPSLAQGSTTLGAAWLLLPAGLVALALLVPVSLLVLERVRGRRARRAHDASRPA